jgi:hypothetical protein
MKLVPHFTPYKHLASCSSCDSLHRADVAWWLHLHGPWQIRQIRGDKEWQPSFGEARCSSIILLPADRRLREHLLTPIHCVVRSWQFMPRGLGLGHQQSCGVTEWVHIYWSAGAWRTSWALGAGSARNAICGSKAVWCQFLFTVLLHFLCDFVMITTIMRCQVACTKVVSLYTSVPFVWVL